MQIDPDWITSSSHVPAVVDRVNDQLPDNIRAFSCFRVSCLCLSSRTHDHASSAFTQLCFLQSVNSFVAKEVCNMREYEYLLPLELVHDHAKGLSDEQKQDLMEKLNKVALCIPRSIQVEKA